MSARALLSTTLAALVGAGASASCNSASSTAPGSSIPSAEAGPPSSDASTSSGSSGSGSGSDGSASSGGGSPSGTDSGGSSSGASDSGPSDGSSTIDGSIPPGIPTAGTCAKIPVIHGDPIVAKLLAIAAQSKCTGSNVVSAHAYTKEGGGGGTANVCKLNGAVYYESGMNIDCDGLPDTCGPQHCPSDDPTNQAQTSFTDAKGQYLSAGLTPYVVIPSDFTYPGLDTKNGGNVIAVLYANQLEFAVFGDTGPTSIIGEASYATANNLGIAPDPATGGTAGPVTYIVFTGTGTAPADLSNPLETWQLGMSLAEQLVANNP